MKKKILIITISYSILFADNTFFDKMSKKELSQSIVNKISSHLPINLDKTTKITKIYTKKENIIILKQLDIKNQEIKEAWNNKKIRKFFIKTMFKFDSKFICKNKIWNYLINKRDIIPEIEYQDLNNKKLFKYKIKSKDCLTINK